MIVRLLQSLIRAYKKAFSPQLHSSCRFTPTCSDYALEALERHGAFFGSLLTMWRILRCNPFSAGGLDTVPMHLVILSAPFARRIPMTLQTSRTERNDSGSQASLKLHPEVARTYLCHTGCEGKH